MPGEVSFVAVLRILFSVDRVPFANKENVVARRRGGDMFLSDVELMLDDGV